MINKSEQPTHDRNLVVGNEVSRKDTDKKIRGEETSSKADTAQVVVFSSVEPRILSKKFKLSDSGELVKIGGGNLVKGKYKIFNAPDPKSFVSLLNTLKPSQATSYGLPKNRVEQGDIVCTGGARKGQLTRTRKNFAYPAGPAWMMFDVDEPGHSMDQVKEHFRKAIPGFDNAPTVFAHSSSAFIYKKDECLIGEGGKRVYILIKDGQDIDRAAKAIADRIKINGTLHYMVSKAGHLLERCLIDEAVYQPERLDFSGKPLILHPLRQHRPVPEIQNNDAEPLDTAAVISDLDEKQQSILGMMREAEKEKVKDQVIEIRGKWVEKRVEEQEIKADKKLSDWEKEKLRTELNSSIQDGTLSENFILYPEKDPLVTVGEILKDPERWHGKRFADPLEPDYNGDNRIATAYLKDEKKPSIWSFAHGGQRFWLSIERKVLEYKTGGLPTLVKDCMGILKSSGVVYQSNKELVRVAKGEKYIVTEPWLRNKLDACINFKKEKMMKKGPECFDQDCPGELAKRIIAGVGEWSLHELDKIIDLPVMRKDGSIVAEPGYDPDTNLILLNGEYRHIVEKIPENPTKENVKEALERIWRPFQYFPFKSPVDRGVFLSTILTVPVRTSLMKAPGCLFRAPVYGTGKTKMAESIAEMTNKAYTMMSWPDKQDDQRKSLTAEMRRSPEMIIFDNLIGTWSSPDLAKIFTTGLHSDRVMGKSEMIDFKSSCMILGTGNNVTVGGDLARRILICELDPQEERPDKRKFPFDPVVEARRNVDQIRVDVLTVLRGYIHAGRPQITSETFGSFEDWDGIIRQTVCWIAENELFPAAIGDPVDSINANFQEDPNTKKLRAFLCNAYEQYQGKPFTVSELVKASTPNEFDWRSDVGDEDIGNLYAVLWEISGQGKTINTRVLGKWLSTNSDRILDNLKILRGPPRSGYTTYSVVLAGSGGLGGLGGSVSDSPKKNVQNINIAGDRNETHQSHQTHCPQTAEGAVKVLEETDHGFDI